MGGVSLSGPPSPKGWVRPLPPTLRISARGTTPGCGEAPRGLLSVWGVAGL